MSNKVRYLIPFVWLLLLFGCKETIKDTPPIPVEKQVVIPLQNPSMEDGSLPKLFSNGNDLFLTWVSKRDSLSTLNYSKFTNGTWLPSEEILSGTDWFVNWADFPQIAENNGNVLTSFLQKSANGKYTYDVKLNLYNDSTKTWKKNFSLHTDGTASEHGFVSIQPYGKDAFFISWLDGRNTIGGHEDHAEHGAGAMTLRGAFVSFSGEIINEMEFDDRVCDCCNTASTVYDGNVVVAYRDRTENEIRDISIITGNIHTWNEPRTIGSDQWQIAGCPVNGPAIDSFDKSFAIAWFSGVGDEGKVQIVFMGDTQIEPIRIDAGNATGRVDVVMISETEAVVLWMEPQGSDEVIQLVKVDSKGQKSNAITISKTSPERASGFPQLEKVGTTLYVAWTVTSEAHSKIQMASVSLDVL